MPILRVTWQKYFKRLLSFSPFFILLLTLFIQSCSGSQNISIYKSDYSLTEDTAYSSLSSMQMRIPKGWFTAEDTICRCIDVWLIRDDFSASLNLVQLKIDTSFSSFEDGLKYLINYSKTQKQSKIKNFVPVNTEEYFPLNEKPFAAYEYTGDEGYPIRVVIFEYENKYWEFSALPASEIGKGRIDSEELFRVQNSVLTSIK